MTSDGAESDARAVQEEPWWVVVAELAESEFSSATVDAPTEDDARAEAERVIASVEETQDFEIARITGPFPRSPGAQNVAVRPSECGGCGLHRWKAEDYPRPQCTWFERQNAEGDTVTWSCIQCGTLTALSREDLVI